jgi:hypothetical protein
VLGFERSKKLNEALGLDENLRAEFLIPFGTSEEAGVASYRLGLDDIFEVK